MEIKNNNILYLTQITIHSLFVDIAKNSLNN